LAKAATGAIASSSSLDRKTTRCPPLVSAIEEIAQLAPIVGETSREISPGFAL
jgi:hypothetical protein